MQAWRIKKWWKGLKSIMYMYSFYCESSFQNMVQEPTSCTSNWNKQTARFSHWQTKNWKKLKIGLISSRFFCKPWLWIIKYWLYMAPYCLQQSIWKKLGSFQPKLLGLKPVLGLKVIKNLISGFFFSFFEKIHGQKLSLRRLFYIYGFLGSWRVSRYPYFLDSNN